ncbi:3-oxoacyl-[acyl-carrier-protein] synthase III C-terminal domain-containing protein [Catellatospora sp. KI3]|uniref:3-oxoacyl-[acyl-carrier-protein] synthase III C-terminal domain-containing protein n=1 Tax=Catellatospora sp. KI3 TaxID=3041620 RepID=UPI002482532D|nr:3-oxoacyl-[acyl-carrier-protein] synthase III C-terminal domain-containing protein [Catellatospora sp. KI3]MDI1463581.1 3-oxoacyl-[acyl-carrier-protein] synthase III C-terminal domain-containing protein [Catellatospora sp. KI3]
MTALLAVAAYLPERRIPIDDLADELGLEPMQVKVFKRYHGLAEIRGDDGTLLDLLLAAAARLEPLRGREHLVRYVIYARAIPVGAPFPHNPLHELCRRLGLDRALAFTVTQQACASGLQALDIAGRLLAADPDPDALALVVAGEKTFTRESRLLPETSLFGEGSAACLVASGGPRDRLLAFASSTRGEFDGEHAEVALDFQRQYPAILGQVILAAVERAGLPLDDVALLLPHNVNLISWQKVCRRIGLPTGRVVLDNIARYGHVFCADAFINYETARDRLRPSDRYVIAAAGAGRGATFSAMVFQH